MGYDSDNDSTYYPGTDTSSTQSEQEVFNNWDEDEDSQNMVAIPGRNNPWIEEEEKEEEEEEEKQEQDEEEEEKQEQEEHEQENLAGEEINMEDGAEAEEATIENMDTRYGARSGHYNLRPRKAPDYSHIHTTVAMTQYSMKKGLEVFGEAGKAAITTELQQLHDLKALEPCDPKSLTYSEKKAALQYLMFLKEKRNGVIKGRGCADGRKQREYIAKEDASSPTVAIESVMLSCTIDAKEGRDIATADIPGAFLQSDMDEKVHMRLDGTMAELLVKIEPTLYQKFLQTEHGKPVLYVELRKALYGTL
jgi:hypothetical protein